MTVSRHPARARHRRRLLGVALGLAVLAGTAGCTGLVRSDGVYASKAAATAEAAGSAVQTAQLAVQEAAAGRLLDRTLAQTLAEAARDAGDAQATFDGIQPPDGRADALRRQLDGLLVPAVSVLADLRIAARRGDVAELPRLAAPLRELGAKLEQFQEAHQ
jgi:type VI protein secretion system component VasK